MGKNLFRVTATALCAVATLAGCSSATNNEGQPVANGANKSAQGATQVSCNVSAYLTIETGDGRADASWRFSQAEVDACPTLRWRLTLSVSDSHGVPHVLYGKTLAATESSYQMTGLDNGREHLLALNTASSAGFLPADSEFFTPNP